MNLFIPAFLTVFLLVFQQQNVAHRRYLWATTTSVAITVSQFILIKTVSVSDIQGMIYMATGGVLGVLSSMYIHPRLMKFYGDSHEKETRQAETAKPGGKIFRADTPTRDIP